MGKPKKLALVVGAGASNEVGLPLGSDLKKRIALEVGDGVVKTLKIYGPTQPKQKGLWRVPTMGKKDY